MKPDHSGKLGFGKNRDQCLPDGPARAGGVNEPGVYPGVWVSATETGFFRDFLGWVPEIGQECGRGEFDLRRWVLVSRCILPVFPAFPGVSLVRFGWIMRAENLELIGYSE